MSTFHIISIDPGNNLGVAVYELDSYTLTVVNLHTEILILDKHVDLLDVDNRLLNKTLVLRDYCEYLSRTYQPIAVMAESAFLNSKFPKAVMQLSHIIATIEIAFKTSNPLVKLFRYPPKYVKRMIGAGGNADKDMMTTALTVIPEITSYIDPVSITEHEVDAIAIGYVGIQEVRSFPHIMYLYE